MKKHSCSYPEEYNFYINFIITIKLNTYYGNNFMELTII
jgi:hypothetical protein